MNMIDNQLSFANARLITAAALVVVTTLSLAPLVAFAMDKDAHADKVELRIQDMHSRLKITPAEEMQWAKVAQVMRDDAKTMDTLTQARVDRSKDMTAVDNLKTYGEITEAHANQIKRLIPVFADLYADMSDAQKKQADTLFRYGDRIHNHKMPQPK